MNDTTKPLPLKAKLYISLIVVIGFAVLALSFLHWETADRTRFFCYLLLATLASGFKVALPGINGSMSVNFLFILIGVVELRFSEVVLIGCAGTALQCVWRSRSSVKPVQVVFSLGNMAIATAASYWAYHYPFNAQPYFKLPFLLALSACTFFVANTFPVAMAIALSEGKRFRKVWKECYFWCFSYYLVGAAVAGLLSALNRVVGWQPSMLVMPLIYWIYRSYR